jgi:hypothetical protein
MGSKEACRSAATGPCIYFEFPGTINRPRTPANKIFPAEYFILIIISGVAASYTLFRHPETPSSGSFRLRNILLDVPLSLVPPYISLNLL